MKRFIDLGNQTGNIDRENGEVEFAFYCTVLDKFMEFGGNQTWTNRSDFIGDLELSECNEMERYLRLIPDHII